MFELTNFTVTMTLLLGFTIVVMSVRSKKPVENNWPVLYWFLLLFFTIVRSEETFNFLFIAIGLGAGLLLRFEFLNNFFTKLVRLVEGGVFVYVLIRGVNVLFS